jgi:hypothetical protein
MIRKDIKRRTLQLGSEISGGASRTVFRPAMKSDVSAFNESLSQPATLNDSIDIVPHVAETQTIAGTSNSPLSPSAQEEPPILTPVEGITFKKSNLEPGMNTTYVRRGIPGTNVQSVRRVPYSVTSRPNAQVR